MGAISLIGLTVYIGDNDQTNALELIQYFYPSHCIIQTDDVFPQDNRLIYVEGYSPAVAASLRGNINRQVIYVVQDGHFDIDFTNRGELLRFVYGKWGIEAEYLLTEDDIENIKHMALFDFYNFIKPRWVSKDLCLYDETDTYINIHSIIGQGFNEILRLCDSITADNVVRLEMGLIQFIETARNRSQTKSKAYSKYNDLYKQFNVHFSNDYIALALARYRDMANSKRFKLIWLLSQFSFNNGVSGI